MERVARWISQTYPRPTIDPAWLSDCSDWISSTHNITPSTHFQEFITRVEEQLLQSNLEDSTAPGTGLDPQLVQSEDRPSRTRPLKPSSRLNRRQQGQRRKKVDTGPTPLLVEIRSITEIAHSAFSLLNTHQTRLDRADLGLARDDDNQQEPRQQDEDEGPIPRFPRGMLGFELSDGHTRFRAIEYRSVPDLVLGETPLGYKMLLTSTPIRNGVAFLEPSNVTLKGYQTEDHDAHREEVFLSGLRKRLGRPDPPEAHVQQQAQPQPAQAAPPIPAQPRTAPPRQHQPTRAPLPTDLDDMYEDDDIDPEMLNALAQMETNAVGPTALSGRTSTGSGATTQPTVRSAPNIKMHRLLTVAQQQTSLHFPSSAEEKTTSSSVPDIGLSPVRAQPSRQAELDITWDSDESDAFRAYAEGPSTKVHATAKITSPHKRGSAVESTHNGSAEPRTAGKNTVLVPPRDTRLKGYSASTSTSIDPYDSFSMDLDLDDDFLAEVDKAEQQALASTTGSGPTSQIRRECDQGKGENVIRVSSTESSQRPTTGWNADLRFSTTLSGSSTGKRPRSTSDVGSSSMQQHADLRPPPSTQPPRVGPSIRREGSPCRLLPSQEKPTKRRLTRDPTVIVISSSDSEADNSAGAEDSVPQSQQQIKLERRGDSGDREMLDVINISD